MRSKLIFFVLWLWLGCGLPIVWASLDDGLIGYWPLNGDALDHSGNDNHGTMLPGALFIPNPSGIGQVLQNVRGWANTGHVQIGLPASYHPGHQVVGYEGSGAFWVMFDDRVPWPTASGAQYPLANPPGMLYVERVLDADSIRTQVQRVERVETNKAFWPASARGTVEGEGVWYHVAWTFHSHNQGQEGQFSWYINGQLSATFSAGVQTQSSSNFRIGARWDAYASNSKMGEVRLYDRILSAAEIEELAHWKGFHPRGHYPAWWAQYGVVSPTADLDDYAAVNQGQLKHVATQATEYLDDALEEVGGAGASLDALVTAWASPASEGDDYAGINQGQLKYVASLFFDRLNEVGFSAWPDAMTIDPATGYPWPASAEEADHYALVNIGQLKWLFSWELDDFMPLEPPVIEPEGYERSYVVLTAPQSGTYAVTGATLQLEAAAHFLGATISQVNFYVDDVSLGAGDTSAPYQGSWTPSSAGEYLLSASATSASSEVIRSSYVRVRIESDANSNGLGDDWEAHYGITNPNDDSDGDGLLASEEFASGKSPHLRDHPSVKLQLLGIGI